MRMNGGCWTGYATLKARSARRSDCALRSNGTPSGGAVSPTLSQAATLAARGPAQAPPVPDPQDPSRRLGQAVDDIYFPNWAGDLGWRATGQRVDRLGDHRAVTVYYQSVQRRIAYTIVSAPALNQPAGANTELAGLQLHTVTLRGRQLVTWRRDGRTCVLSGAGIPAHQLQQLAGRTTTRGA
jgi:hypothetical protein